MSGAVVASDGFLMFGVAVEYASERVVREFVLAGGSIRVDVVVRASVEIGISIVFTGMGILRL